MISSKVSFGKKGWIYFIGYKDDVYKIKLFSRMLPKMIGYAKKLDGTKYALFD